MIDDSIILLRPRGAERVGRESVVVVGEMFGGRVS